MARCHPYSRTAKAYGQTVINMLLIAIVFRRWTLGLLFSLISLHMQCEGLEWPCLWNCRQSTCFARPRNRLGETKCNFKLVGSTYSTTGDSTGKPQIKNAPEDRTPLGNCKADGCLPSRCPDPRQWQTGSQEPGGHKCFVSKPSLSEHRICQRSNITPNKKQINNMSGPFNVFLRAVCFITRTSSRNPEDVPTTSSFIKLHYLLCSRHLEMVVDCKVFNVNT
jgi:hypothetical protein